MSNAECEFSFVRLSDISPEEIINHMSDPRIAKHLPLHSGAWDRNILIEFIAGKEQCWQRDGLGHWAILRDGVYIGWGGFQREGDEWDFGLVLKPDYFGLGIRIVRKAIEFAKADDRIPFFTILLPPTRTKLGALAKLGARFVGAVDCAGATFRKYRLDTC